MPRDAAFTQTLCADAQRFSLHAAVRCGANKRKHLEQRCRYIARPALANERVQCKNAGQVVLTLRTACREGTTHRGGMLDLNALIDQADPLRASFVLTQARAIDEGGWIVGTALAGGVLHAVLLTPVPAPSAAALRLLAGAAWACCVRIRSRAAVRRAPQTMPATH